MQSLFRPSFTRVLLWVSLLLGFAGLAHAAAGFDPVAETEKYLGTIPAAARAKSDAYFEGGYWLQLWGLVVPLALTVIMLKFGWAQKIRDLAERCFKNRFLQGLLFAALILVLNTVLSLPWDYYTGFVREHHYDLSNLTTGGWLIEQAKGLAVSVVLLSPVISLLYLGIRKSPQRWWVIAGVATPFFMFLGLLIAPVYISPLFNEYKPLENAAVRDPILSMARANSVPVNNVYEFDASKQTKRISANVSGAFSTIRVSLNDNLLTRCTPAEVQAVMGHELGHYVLNHVYKLVVYLTLVFAAAFAFTHWFFDAAQKKFGAAWGVRDIGDFASLPLLMAGFGVFMFLSTPVQNSITHSTEAEADIFGLNAARQPDGFATTALKLSEYRKLAPGKWEEIFFFDHPSGYQRILMAMRWKAEHLAEFPAGK
jgi:STE24 endopeptidase